MVKISRVDPAHLQGENLKVFARLLVSSLFLSSLNEAGQQLRRRPSSFSTSRQVSNCVAAAMDQASSLCHTTLSLVVAGLVLLVTIVIYRRYLSPLSTIPGPFWASFSRLWHLRITVQGNQNEQLTEAHEKYGHFVRLANNEVSVSHPDAVRKILLAPLEKVSFPHGGPQCSGDFPAEGTEI